MNISVILLAGGVGSRMKSPLPKQFLPLGNKVIALHSFEIFQQLEEITEMIVVCAEEFRHFFSKMPVKFAKPGHRRQDSLYNGLQMATQSWICTHDAARPFITRSLVKQLFEGAVDTEAASLALPVKNTLKEIHADGHVVRTLDRSYIWEIQTPQLIKKEILNAGFAYARARDLSVTDDVSLAELVGASVRLVQGSHKNIKITNQEDLAFATWIIQQNIECASPTMEHAIAAGRSSQIASPFKK